MREQNGIAYSPLASGQIRVLEIDTTHTNRVDDRDEVSASVLHVRLKTVVLDDQLQYYAISYMWGDPTKSRSIMVDGKPIMVTQNLAQALEDICHHMAGDTRPILGGLPVWADAICINQADNDEKSTQVARMGEIYTNAQRVLVFVDQSSSPAEVDTAMCILWDLARLFHSPQFQAFLRSATKNASSYPESTAETYRSLIEPLVSRPHGEIKCLGRFTQREGRWWERAWVMQEIGLAKTDNVLLVCGPYTLEWSAVVACCRWDSREAEAFGYKGRPHLTKKMFKEHIKNLDLIIASINMVRAFMVRIFHETSRTLDFHLYHTRLTNPDPPKASVAHDVLYSLLFLSNDRETCGIVPDYNKTYHELFRDSAIYILQTQRAYALQCCWYDETTPEFPYSWIPNWCGGEGRLSYQFWPGTDGWRAYNASNDRSAWWHAIDGYQLRLRGQSVGKVANLARIFTTSQQHYGHDMAQLEPARYWLSHFNDFVSWLGKETLERPDDVWRVPIADQNPVEVTRATEDFEKGYEELSDESIDLDNVSEAAQMYGWGLNIIVKGGLKKKTGREVFVTSTGFLGLAPPTVREGDYIFIIAGADIPLILRKVDDQEKYRIVGETFLDGIMDGEFAAIWPPTQEIVII